MIMRRWWYFPFGLGTVGCSYALYEYAMEGLAAERGLPRPWPAWRVYLYKSYPLRRSSRIVAKVMNTEIPQWLRPLVMGVFVHRYNVQMRDAEIEDPLEYSSLAALFNRRLKPNMRPISNSALVCPSDGRVQRVGDVRDNHLIEQVKGVDYQLHEFLGNDIDAAKILRHKDTTLKYVSIYLAPGDYHAFHSPADWRIDMRRHIHGEMLSVKFRLLDKVSKLFTLNERVALMGQWKHGFMSMIAVAATNVGDIHIDFDQFATNVHGAKLGSYDDLVYGTQTGITKQKVRGERIGEFRFGSSIVLVFEAPTNFKFCVQPGDKVRFGQTLGVDK